MRRVGALRQGRARATRPRPMPNIPLSHASGVAPPRRRRGFSLLELLVVVAILAVLAGLAFSHHRGTQQRLAADVETVQIAEVVRALRRPVSCRHRVLSAPGAVRAYRQWRRGGPAGRMRGHGVMPALSFTCQPRTTLRATRFRFRFDTSLRLARRPGQRGAAGRAARLAWTLPQVQPSSIADPPHRQRPGRRRQRGPCGREARTRGRTAGRTRHLPGRLRSRPAVLLVRRWRQSRAARPAHPVHCGCLIPARRRLRGGRSL